MSSLPSRSPSSPAARFEGAKTKEPIPVRNPSVRDALIIAALDPAVRAISLADPISIMLDGNPVRHVPDCRLLTDSGVIVVDIYRPSRAAAARRRFESVAAAHAALGLAYARREPPQVFGGPLLMNARSVWACRRVPIGAADQVRVLDLLGAGPVPLAEAARAIRDGDGVACVLALACRDVLVADLASAPLGPETRVSRRSAIVPDAALQTGGSERSS